MGVLGEDKSHRNGAMQVNPVMHQRIMNLYYGSTTSASELQSNTAKVEQPGVIDAQTVTKECGHCSD